MPYEQDNTNMYHNTNFKLKSERTQTKVNLIIYYRIENKEWHDKCVRITVKEECHTPMLSDSQ